MMLCGGVRADCFHGNVFTISLNSNYYDDTDWNKAQLNVCCFPLSLIGI